MMLPPEIPEHIDLPHIISLGAGVQSSTMALMAAHGEIKPTPTACVFADTMAEPASVYRWLDFLETQLPFPVYRVTKGDLAADALRIREKKDGTGQWCPSAIPYFTIGENGKKGQNYRQCTSHFKVEPINKELRRLAQVPRRSTAPKVIEWIGISTDEIIRAKDNREPWIENRHPLIELGLSRADCLRWMESHGYPRPPRSACIFCPFHNDKEWIALRDEAPEEFAAAVQFERDFQAAKAATVGPHFVPYLHPDRIPLDQVRFREDRQLSLWGNECEGLCGV